jgi:hypothetical protein
MQREEQPVMATGRARIAAKPRGEPKLRFTSLAHRLTRERAGRIAVRFPAIRPLGGSDSDGGKEEFRGMD